MSNNMGEVNDIYDLITKIINPKLNNVIGLLYGYGGMKKGTYKIDYATAKQFTPESRLAKEIEEWREEIYRKYDGKDLKSLRYDLIGDYWRFFRHVCGELQKLDSKLAKIVFDTMFELGGIIEMWLDKNKEFFSVYNLLTEKNKELSDLQERITSLEDKIKEKEVLIGEIESEYKGHSQSMFKKGLALGFISGIAVMGALVYLLFL
ncbi:hypothetical protein [Geoglobus acetivorans]|uniref:Uncharacterized protein n=1 Tax=Geoglobus acetivorans TaxID=565033 RepID=A0ABZ3H615_GEOAI|nr:hypothetical protein [Geoglobus acetivorans]